MNKILVLCAATGFLMACNPQKDNNPISNVGQAVKDVKLQGKHFYGPCTTSGAGATVVQFLPSSQVSYKFEGSNVTRMTAYFPSTDCKGSAAYNMKEIGQINIMTDKQTPDGARYLDLNFNRLSVEIVSQAGADAGNRLKMCGVSDWGVGQPDRDMTQVAATATCLNSKLELERQIYRVEGDVLVLGNRGVSGAMARDQEGRPTQLDRETKYVAGK